MLRGLVAGDKIGGPTQMSIQLANVLLNDLAFNSDHISDAYQAWWLDRGFDTGRVARMVFNLRNSGLAVDQAVEMADKALNNLTAGCNPAHRGSPLAAAFFLPTSRLSQFAREEANLTHKHQLAGDVSTAVVVLCRHLIEGINWNQSIAIAKKQSQLETKHALCIGELEQLRRDGYAPHVLQASIYFVHTSANFTDALDRALDFAGPANYCPVLVGIIGGARWGYHSIPKRQLSHNRDLDTIDQIAQQFVAFLP